MSAERHFSRLQRLQRIHALLVRRQAGRLAEAEAAAHRASERLVRIAALLDTTAATIGPQLVGTLSGSAHLRGLLARSMAAERDRAVLAEESRRAAAQQQRVMDARADRIGDRVAAARRRFAFDLAEGQAGGSGPEVQRSKKRKDLP